MTTELKNEVDSIVKFVGKLFNPSDVEIRPVKEAWVMYSVFWRSLK